jgi:hypothetical protein
MLIKVPEHRPSIQQLIHVHIIQNAILSFDKEFEDKYFSEPQGPLVKKDSTLKEESLKPLIDRVSYSLLHAQQLSPTISEVDVSTEANIRVFFLYLSGDRLYI